MLRLSYIVLSLFISLKGWAEINYHQSLVSLGLKNGIELRNDSNSKHIIFELPDLKLIKQAELQLEIEYGQLNLQNGQIDVSVENRPLSRIQLLEQASENGMIAKNVTIKIPQELLTQSTLSVRFELSANNNTCVEQNNNAKQLVFIKPQSKMAVILNYSPLQINDFILTLPEHVFLQIPKRKLTAQEFNNVAVFALALHQRNKVVKISEHSSQNPKHIIFGTQEELNKIFSISTAHLIDLAMLAKSSVMTINSSSEQSISPIFNLDSELLNQKNIHSLKDFTNIENAKGLSFKIPTQYEESYKGQRWSLNFKNHNLPGSVVAKTARIQMTTPPSTNGSPVLLFIYLDHMLVHGQELEANGKLEDLSIDLPLQIKKHGSELSIQVMRSDITRICGFADDHSLKSQLGPNSSIEFTEYNAETKTLSEFSRQANRSLTISLPAIALSASSVWLSHTQLILNSIDPKLSSIRFDFYESQPKTDINGAHVIIADYASNLVTSTAHPEVKNLRNLFAVQLGKYHEKTVLTYQSGKFDLPPTISHFTIDESTGMIFEQTRVLKHIPISQTAEKNVTKEIIGELEFNIRTYRYYIFAVLWLILTLAFIRIGKLLK